VVVLDGNPSTQETETGLNPEFEANLGCIARPCLKNKAKPKSSNSAWSFAPSHSLETILESAFFLTTTTTLHQTWASTTIFSFISIFKEKRKIYLF
jgi:hypothetical protein